MKQHFQAGIGIALAFAAIALAAVLAFKLAALLLLVVIALVITIGIDPVVQRLQSITVRGRRLPRVLAALLILTVALLVLLGITTFFVATAASEAMRFATDVWPGMQKSLLRWLEQFSQEHRGVIPPPEVLYQRLSAQSEQIAGYVWSTTRAVFGVIGGIFSLISVFILTLFFTISKDGITYTLLQFVPPRHQRRVAEIGHLAAEKMGGWLRGQIILALIITVTTTLAMLIFRIPYAAIIGVIGGIGELIPMVGPYVAFFPALLIVLATGGEIWQLVAIFIFFGVLSQVENYILAPKVMERQVELSPVSTIFSLLAGGALLGIVGALLAVPLAAGARVILFEAVFPAIQGKSRREIEADCPGAPVKPEPPPEPAEPAPPPTPAPPAPSAAPGAAQRKQRRKGSATGTG